MTLLVLSPDFASHYGPMAVVAHAVRSAGRRVVVATGEQLRERVEADGFEWRLLQLGAGSNAGVAHQDPGLDRFIEATAQGPMATIRLQALNREQDLLWQPERIAVHVARLCDEIEPGQILVDHVSFSSTLAAYATGRSFATLVPGHPSQLPAGSERYGIPAIWPEQMQPEPADLSELHRIVDRVTDAFTARWNSALAAIAPGLPLVEDAFRVHGQRVLFNTVRELHDPARSHFLPHNHHFVGPLVRDERLPSTLHQWRSRPDDTAQVYVALGTFLSHRADVLSRLADALRHLGVRAAIATGAVPIDRLGPLPDLWVVAPRLPQVAMLRSADLIIHHGGNNSVQEALGEGLRQLVLPFSTDQFSNAADLERIGAACVRSPNSSTPADLASAIEVALDAPRPPSLPALSQEQLVDAVFG